MASGSAQDLVWFRGAVSTAAIFDLPLDRYFRDSEVVTFRSGWGDPKALFAGFKAGDNKANHSHPDLGSFVLDALGARWAVDLGADDYNLPGYFGGERWNYYRLRAEGHNTLVINPDTAPDQDVMGAGFRRELSRRAARAEVLTAAVPNEPKPAWADADYPLLPSAPTPAWLAAEIARQGPAAAVAR